ncbi:MAG: STAS domain-containing protein [Proteobacteria bacterium]|jgi:anti-anti-sigma factor|nr:STAS domain-containing protein [Pseudomonadota bacterium]
MALNATFETTEDEARITLGGELDAASASQFKELVEKAAAGGPRRLVLFMKELGFMASAGLRVLIFARQKMGANVVIYVVGAQGPVRNTLEMSGFHRSVVVQDDYAPT